MQTNLSPAVPLVTQAALITGIPQSRIFGDVRTLRLVRTRWAVWLTLRRLGFSLHEIGDMFGRCHGTILFALNKCPALLTKDPLFKALVNHLTDIAFPLLTIDNR